MPAHVVALVIDASAPPADVSVPSTVIWMPSVAWMVAPAAIVTTVPALIVTGVVSCLPSSQVSLLETTGELPPLELPLGPLDGAAEHAARVSVTREARGRREDGIAHLP
jgi:hypothetical protein